VGTLGGFLLTDLGGFPGLSVDPALHVFHAPKGRPSNFEGRGQAMCRVWVLQQIIKITAGYAQPIRQILRAVSQRVRVPQTGLFFDIFSGISRRISIERAVGFRLPLQCVAIFHYQSPVLWWLAAHGQRFLSGLCLKR
jgi:hypothetical protein